MARDFNQNRNTNAKLGKGDLSGYGRHWALQSNLDGYNIVDILIPNVPNDVKTFLEGDDSLEIYAIPTNVEKLCAYSLASFPNLESLYILKYNEIVELETNWDETLVYLDKIYVPESLLSDYQTAYPNETRFDILVENYTLTIPYVGESTLTSEYVDTIINGLSQAQKEAITEVVIDTQFTQASADYIAWNYDFSEIENLNNNIWYGTTKYDFSVLTLSGESGALTSAIVEANILNVPNSKRSAITKVVIPDTFTLNTSASKGCLDSCDTYLPNVNTLELNQAIKTQESGDSVIYSNWKNSSCKFVNIIINYNFWLDNSTFDGAYIKYFESSVITRISAGCFNDSKLEYAIVPNVSSIESYGFGRVSNYDKDIYLPKITTLVDNAFQTGNIDRLYLPRLTTCNCHIGRCVNNYIYIGTEDITGSRFNNQRKYKLTFVKANKLVNFMTNSLFVGYEIYLAGIIDGAELYVDKEFNYPKLTGIDTETNIQLLTPSDNALYLASDTGNLWQYSSSAWTNLFSGYTATWYSDEDCTITIQPSAITNDMTVYVKLTAI